MVADTIKCSFCNDTVSGLLHRQSDFKGLVVDMDVIFMSFENFCFAMFLSVTIIPCIVKGVVDVFRWIKERVKNDKN